MSCTWFRCKWSNLSCRFWHLLFNCSLCNDNCRHCVWFVSNFFCKSTSGEHNHHLYNRIWSESWTYIDRHFDDLDYFYRDEYLLFVIVLMNGKRWRIMKKLKSIFTFEVRVFHFVMELRIIAIEYHFWHKTSLLKDNFQVHSKGKDFPYLNNK